jgi:SAM-dependent methyltransferase
MVERSAFLEASSGLSDRVWDALACPACHGRLQSVDDAVHCVECGERYPRLGSQLDLRPRRATRVAVDHEVGHLEAPSTRRIGPLRSRPGSPHDPHVIRWTARELSGCRMTPALFTHVPDLPSSGGLLLDLGCGNGVYAPLLRTTGFEYVGLDYEANAASVLGDAHLLPFADASIDVVVMISLLEHLRTPSVAMRELLRVLVPGGTLVGTVAFMEPFHLQSYFHHSHLGTVETLEDAGFRVVVVAPASDWPGLHGLAELGLFKGLPGVVGRTTVQPVEALHGVWWWLGRRLARVPSGELDRRVLMPGGFRFVCRRPPDQGEGRG